MRTINTEENAIIKLLNSKNKNAVKTLDLMFVRFDSCDDLSPSIHTKLIWTIYVKQDHKNNYQLSSQFQTSETTLLRYRKKYIEFFKNFYKHLAA